MELRIRGAERVLSLEPNDEDTGHVSHFEAELLKDDVQIASARAAVFHYTEMAEDRTLGGFEFDAHPEFVLEGVSAIYEPGSGKFKRADIIPGDILVLETLECVDAGLALRFAERFVHALSGACTVAVARPTFPRNIARRIGFTTVVDDQLVRLLRDVALEKSETA